MILFSETEFFMNGIYAIAQLLYLDKKTFTILGELHGKYWECKGNKISPWEYCAKRISDNPNCSILLEYDKSLSEESILQLESKSITDIYLTLEQQNKKYKIVPYDIRQWFLGIELHQTLYHGNYIQNKLKKGNFSLIQEKFIDSFHNKCKLDKKFLDTSSYDGDIKKLMENIKHEILESFDNISKHIKTKDPEIIHKLLKENWQKVTDYFLLTIIFNDNKTDEYIILGGMYHFDFLVKELEKLTVIVNIQEFNEKRNSNNCAKVYEPIIF